MALTVGTGPFGQRPGGVFNFELPRRKGVIYFEDSPRRIRARLGAETVVDSSRAKLLHEHGHLPIYYFPQEDVRMDLLEPSDHSSFCPYKGQASYWSVRVGDLVAENAVWGYPDPIEDAPPLAGYLAFLGQDGRVAGGGRARDRARSRPVPPRRRAGQLPPCARARRRRGGRRHSPCQGAVRDRAADTLVHPTRGRTQRAAVDSDQRTGCAYKGFAAYWSVKVGDQLEQDLVWTYRDPRREVEPIRDHLAFFNERVDLEIDGELEQRPITQWSPKREPKPAAQDANR